MTFEKIVSTLFNWGELDKRRDMMFLSRLKPNVYMYDNLRPNIKIISFSLNPRGIQMEEECFHCQSWNYLASSNQVWAWLQSAIEFTITSPLECRNHFMFFCSRMFCVSTKNLVDLSCTQIHKSVHTTSRLSKKNRK